jgi:starch-binding outer membrane protein, SusD/RagB family
MKRILIIIGVVFWLVSCQKESLELVNPNAPGIDALKTEAGIAKAAYGVYGPLRYNSGFYFTWFTQWAHNIMGDATVSSVGNFGIRWANQTNKIIRPGGVIVTPPVGGSQPVELDNRNSRDWGSDNPQAFEWFPLYALIGHCNLLLSIVDDVQFSGSATEVEIKVKTYKAWLLWWKGFAYSRLGSIHSQGLVVNAYSEISSNYVPNTALIAEANRNFGLAKDILATLTDGNAAYNIIMGNLIPTHFQAGNGGIISPSMFIRNINTYLARNILVNKYATELTAADYTAIEALTNAGIQPGDKIFTTRSAETNCFVYTTAWAGYRLNLAWERVSERLIQDFRPGDNRYTRNVMLIPAGPIVNPSARGFQYGTRYQMRSVDVGGDFMSYTAGLVEIPMAGSYEENQLMLAELKIRRGDVEAGLAHIDNTRSHQNSGLATLVGTGLTQAQALEELRSERRIGLFMKGVAFYDARRWGVLRSLEQGGGRQNANVVFLNDGTAESCTIEYLYKEWWDVPANETDFNPIPSKSAFIPKELSVSANSAK